MTATIVWLPGTIMGWAEPATGFGENFHRLGVGGMRDGRGGEGDVGEGFNCSRMLVSLQETNRLTMHLLI